MTASSEEDFEIIWLDCKNLRSDVRSVIASTNLWEIEEISAKEWKRTPFQPRNVEEYLKRKTKDKSDGFRRDYALLEGDFMYRHYIMHASGKFQLVGEKPLTMASPTALVVSIYLITPPLLSLVHS